MPRFRRAVAARFEGAVDDLKTEQVRTAERVRRIEAEAAGPRGVIVDLRSGGYQALGRAPGMGGRTATIQADKPGGGRAASVIAKRTRGQVARYLLETGADPRDRPDFR